MQRVKVLMANRHSVEYNITHQRKEVRELSTRLDTADDKSEKQAQQLTNGLREERSRTQQLSEQQNNGH